MRIRNPLLVLVAVAAGFAPAAAAPAAQAVTATHGLYATAYVPAATFPDGSVRWFDVTLGVPSGDVTSTGAAGAVDLAKPWAAMTETVVTGAHGHDADGTAACGVATNPTSYSGGKLAAGGTAWTGVSVDLTCADGAYAFYRVTWSAGPYWLVSDTVSTTWLGGQVALWSTPSVRGVSTLWPQANQQAVVTICGYHSTASRADCFDGAGTVIPRMAGMTVAAYGT